MQKSASVIPISHANPLARRRQHKIYRVSDLLVLPDSHEEWIVRDLFPACQRIIVVGDGATYKSTVIYDLCVAVATGGKMLNYLPIETPGPVLCISTEGSVFANKKRLVMHIRGYNADPALLEQNLRWCQQAFLLDDVQDQIELFEIVSELKPVLIVMDPLDSFFSGEENSAKETKAFRRVVDALVDEHSCSVLIIHHIGKGDSPRPRGSSAWYDWADTVVHSKKKVIGKGKDKFDIAEWVVTKQRCGVDGHVFTVVPDVNPEFGQIIFDFYDEEAGGRVADRRLLKSVYNALLLRGPMTTSMVEEVIPYSKERVRQALADLEGMSLVDKGGAISAPVRGRQPRSVSAWRALRRMMAVDAAAAVLRAAAAYRIEDELMADVVSNHADGEEVVDGPQAG